VVVSVGRRLDVRHRPSHAVRPPERAPTKVHRRYWGATGWLILAGLTVGGASDLVDDVSTLR
jgi:hypothetical protein